MSDLRINPQTGDLDISVFDFSLVSGIEEIAQRIRIRLKFFLGEWFLNINYGIPYFQEVFVKNTDLSELNAIFKNAILTTPGVAGLSIFSFDFQGAQRKLKIIFVAETVYGNLSFNEILEILA